MTQVLTIPTPFADVGELTENFAQRVDEERLMLPHPEPMPEGEWVQFNVLLGDGELALAGVGRVQGAFDNGEEHPAEYRFDVVLDSLQFEGMHEVMFERLLVARSTQIGDSPVTGEVSVEELEAHAAAEAAAQQPQEEEAHAEELAEAAPTDAGWDHDGDAADVADVAAAEDWHDAAPAAALSDVDDDGDSTLAMEASAFDPGTGEVDVGDLEEMRAVAPKPAARPPTAPYPTQAREPGTLPSPHSFNGVALTRASLPAAWAPEPALRPEAAQSSGFFDYERGIPRPASPPRPELDASLRVQGAPRPGAPWPRRGTGQHVVVASEAPSEEAAFDDLGDDEDALTAGDEQVEAPIGDPEHEEW